MPKKKKPSKLSKFSLFKNPKVLVALVFVLGFASFGAHKLVTSHAAATPFLENNQLKITACKTEVKLYGGVYQVKVRFIKPPGSIHGPWYYVQVFRGTRIIKSISDTAYWGGTTAEVVVNASAYYGDRVKIAITKPFYWAKEFNPAGKVPSYC